MIFQRNDVTGLVQRPYKHDFSCNDVSGHRGAPWPRGTRHRQRWEPSHLNALLPQKFVTTYFSLFCSFMQSFQLQSSKVSKDYKRKVQFILNFDKIYFSYKYLTNLKNVPVKTRSEQKRVALPKPKPPTLLHGEPSCSHPSPTLKVRTSNMT